MKGKLHLDFYEKLKNLGKSNSIIGNNNDRTRKLTKGKSGATEQFTKSTSAFNIFNFVNVIKSKFYADKNFAHQFFIFKNSVFLRIFLELAFYSIIFVFFYIQINQQLVMEDNIKLKNVSFLKKIIQLSSNGSYDASKGYIEQIPSNVILSLNRAIQSKNQDNVKIICRYYLRSFSIDNFNDCFEFLAVIQSFLKSINSLNIIMVILIVFSMNSSLRVIYQFLTRKETNLTLVIYQDIILSGVSIYLIVFINQNLDHNNIITSFYLNFYEKQYLVIIKYILICTLFMLVFRYYINFHIIEKIKL